MEARSKTISIYVAGEVEVSGPLRRKWTNSLNSAEGGSQLENNLGQIICLPRKGESILRKQAVEFLLAF